MFARNLFILVAFLRIMTGKIFVSAEQLLLDSYRLAKMVYSDGFTPDFLVGLWRGGTPVGIAVHEYFKYRGINPNHIPLKTQLYQGQESTHRVEVIGMENLFSQMKGSEKILIVDDVFDSGLTIDTVLSLIEKRFPKIPVIRVATVYYKPKNNQTERKPDYFVNVTEGWIVFPHEIEGLSPEELRMKNPVLFHILNTDRDRKPVDVVWQR